MTGSGAKRSSVIPPVPSGAVLADDQAPGLPAELKVEQLRQRINLIVVRTFGETIARLPVKLRHFQQLTVHLPNHLGDQKSATRSNWVRRL